MGQRLIQFIVKQVFDYLLGGKPDRRFERLPGGSQFAEHLKQAVSLRIFVFWVTCEKLVDGFKSESERTHAHASLKESRRLTGRNPLLLLSESNRSITTITALEPIS